MLDDLSLHFKAYDSVGEVRLILTQVQQLPYQLVMVAEEDVGGLDIAMDHAEPVQLPDLLHELEPYFARVRYLYLYLRIISEVFEAHSVLLQNNELIKLFVEIQLLLVFSLYDSVVNDGGEALEALLLDQLAGLPFPGGGLAALDCFDHD